MSKKLEKDQKPQEFNPYENDKTSKIPSWLKILFLKYWVAAATLFFFIIGNPLFYVEGQEVTISTMEVYYIFTILGLGLFTEYITRPLVRMMRTSKDDTFKYNLINFKGVLALFANLLYAAAISVPMYIILTYLASKGWVLDLLGNGGAIEPFTGGLVYIILDSIVVWTRNLILKIIFEVKFKKYNKEALELENKLLQEEGNA